MTNPKLLIKYPYYSVDSTGWHAGVRWGQMLKWQDLEMKGYYYKKRDSCLKGGLDIKIMGHWTERLNDNIRAYKKLEEDITRLWEKRGIKWD